MSGSPGQFSEYWWAREARTRAALGTTPLSWEERYRLVKPARTGERYPEELPPPGTRRKPKRAT